MTIFSHLFIRRKWCKWLIYSTTSQKKKFKTLEEKGTKNKKKKINNRQNISTKKTTERARILYS